VGPSPYQAPNPFSFIKDYGASESAPGPDSSRNTAETYGQEFVEIQDRFTCIKASVEKVTLPNHLKLHDNHTGVKKEDQHTLNVVSKCGRYVETRKSSTRCRNP
jgi:hypothetical protein